MKTATKLKGGLLRGNASLYRLSEPHKAYDGTEHSLIVVSAAANAYVYETYIFPADEDGNVTDWMEMPGSEQGTQSHERVLQNAGYEAI